MIENVKYKVADVAKDLKEPVKDVLDVLGEKFPAKKAQAALTEEELNFVFEHYTKKHEVTSFAPYFAMAGQPKTEKKAEEPAPKAEEKPAEKPARKAEEKAAPAPKAEKPAVKEEKKPEQKPAPKAEEKPAEKPVQKTEQKNNERKPAENRQGERRNDQRPERPQNGERKFDNNRPQNGERKFDGNRPQNGERKFDGNRPQNGERKFDGNRPQNGERKFDGNRPQNGERKFDGNRPQNGERKFDGNRPQNGERKFGDKPNFNKNDRFGGNNFGFDKDKEDNSHRHEPKKPVERKPRPANQPPAEKLAAGVAHVDMSAVSVDLDKYNDKYEQIAPASSMSDSYTNKQKLNQKSKQQGKPKKSKHEQEQEKLKKLEMERQRRQKLEITIPDEITVGDLALKLKVTSSEIIKRLMLQGMMVSVNEVIDYDTAALVAMDIGAKVEKEVVVTIEDRLIDDSEDDAANLITRDPVVCVMGHVDHGKTSILDYIRSAHVASGEAGGITQHLGAYRVTTESGSSITFLDTPGHEAFTAMRARGALCTDIAILVVAADDGIMPQTVEAINHAKAAEVSIIVAINKIDKPTANPDKVMQGLTEYGLVPEEWGGDVICVPVSAKTGENIDTLLEMITLVAEVRELKANPDRMAKGTVIESRLDKGRGPVATMLVQNGTLHTGDVVIAGTSVGKVRVMIDDKGNRITEAGPSIPVEITGLDSVPTGGDQFNAVSDEKLARELVEQREYEAKQEAFKQYQKVTLDNLFNQIAEGEIKELPIIVKADVQGSVEAVRQSLEKISNEEVRVRVIHGAVGAVNESDVMLAQVSNAIIVGFNVRPDTTARDTAEREGVDIRLYRIIYDAIEEIESAMKGMLAPKFRDVDLGRAEIRQVYKISNVGTVAGCYVLEGKITRNANIRVVRDGIIIADDKLDSLKRFKDDVKEVASGYECGMTLTKFNDIKEGDIFEAYIVEEYRDN
ncbi:MAG: translation initiation factor IF-2 [Oscillospiraceae bacterium]|nr:translation initiation factor IF-2 [Oscillospiraceae bacterium]